MLTAILLVSVGAKVVQTQGDQKVAPQRRVLDVVGAALLPQEGAAFQGAQQAAKHLRRASAPVAMMPEVPDLPQLLDQAGAAADAVAQHLPTNLLAEIVDGDGERVYGAVEAPAWVAPLGGIAAIGTALLPIALAPGEEAFSRQQGDEKTVNAKFGQGRGNLKRKK